MLNPDFLIETPRLYISYFLPSNPKHCSFLVDLYNSPLFIAAQGKTAIDDESKAQERIQNQFITDHERNGYGQYLVSLKTTPDTSLSDARPIGSVSLMKGEAYSAPDIGFAIIPEMNGYGYATESARTLLDYARNELNVTEVFGFSKPSNLRSRRVMEKLGLENRGIRKLSAFGGATSVVYALPGMKSLECYGID